MSLRINIVLTPATFARIRARAIAERRSQSSLGAILIEDGLNAKPAVLTESEQILAACEEIGGAEALEILKRAVRKRRVAA